MQKRNRADEMRILQRMRMRLTFKRLVRTVVMNIQFMDDEEQGMTMNAKRNVALLIRQKRKTGILTIGDKALLRVPPPYRSIEDRRKLCLIVAGLTCMSRLPPKLRARLVPYLKYEFIHPDRVILRELNTPLYVYFVISGEIEVKKTVYDRNGKKVQISEAIMGPGDWVGEVELLENCPRLNTYVTITQCEILSITDEAFKQILGAYMKKQWQEKKLAIKSLSYFNLLTEAQIVRACTYSQLIQFEPLASIYSENQGALSCVHFILSGECVILQILKMKVIRNNGAASYKLVYVADKQSLEPKQSGRSRESLFEYENPDKSLLLNEAFNIEELLASYSYSDEEENIKKIKAKRKVGLEEIEAQCRKFGFDAPEHIDRKVGKLRRVRSIITSQITLQSAHFKSTDSMEEQLFDGIYEYLIQECIEEVISDIEEWNSESISDRTSFKTPPVRESVMTENSRKPSNEIEIVHFPTIMSKRGTPSDESYVSSTSSEPIVQVAPPSVGEVETHFIEVGSLSYGGVFGLGEKLTHRCIMARTNVQCLQLPRFWLMEEDQNPGNIWQRRRFYLEQCIPSREELFNNFLKTRSWEKFKEDYIQSNLGPQTVNSTKLQDIPTIARIVQHRDDS